MNQRPKRKSHPKVTIVVYVNGRRYTSETPAKAVKLLTDLGFLEVAIVPNGFPKGEKKKCRKQK